MNTNNAEHRILARRTARELTREELELISGGVGGVRGVNNTVSANSCTVNGDEDCGQDD